MGKSSASKQVSAPSGAGAAGGGAGGALGPGAAAPVAPSPKSTRTKLFGFGKKSSQPKSPTSPVGNNHKWCHRGWKMTSCFCFWKRANGHPRFVSAPFTPNLDLLSLACFSGQEMLFRGVKCFAERNWSYVPLWETKKTGLPKFKSLEKKLIF